MYVDPLPASTARACECCCIVCGMYNAAQPRLSRPVVATAAVANIFDNNTESHSHLTTYAASSHTDPSANPRLSR